MMGASKGFVFFQSYYLALRGLNDKERLQMYDAMVNFAFDGEEPELPDNLQAFFELIRPTLEKSIQDRENGSKGGKTPKNRGL